MRKKIHFEIVSRYDKAYEPATVGIPCSKGELKKEQLQQLCLKRWGWEDGERYPAQFKPTAFWDDGSIKWLLIHCMVDLPANQEIDYAIVAGEQEKEVTCLIANTPICKVEELKEGTLIDNGCISVSLATPGNCNLFERIVTPQHTYEKGEIEGPWLMDSDGKQYLVEIGESGWEILEAGTVKIVARTRGRHVCGDKSWFSYSLLLTLWAGKPWINLDYQIINTEEDKRPGEQSGMSINNEQAGLKYDKNYAFELIKEMQMAVRPASNLKSDGMIKHKVYTSSFNYHVKEAGAKEKLSEVITADTVVNTANEMFPEVLFSIFAGDWSDGTHAVTAGIYQAYQNFPKALETSEDGVALQLLPQIGEMLKVPQGVARTTRCYLYFHEPDINERVLVDRLHQFELQPQPVLEPEAYIETGVFGEYVSNRYHHETERFLYRYVDSRAKGLGMLHFGDGPEWEYVKQGRSEGKLIWINNEYDMPHNFMVMLARTGDRRYFDYMRAAVEHWYDVDLCHFSQLPNKEGLLYTHSVDHISGQPVPSHQWVEGFLDYYHTTGSLYALEAANSIGNGLLKLMELPIYHTTATVEPREIGWAMRTFMALYRETYEERWLEACRPIVEVYVKWAEELGTWTTPYPDNYMDRVPFMMHVGLVGLYQYNQVRPDEMIRRTIITVVDDIIRYCYIPRADVFFGKQFPAVRFLNLNGMVLESLAIAYRLTEDQSYIKKGLGMFEWITRENQPVIYDFSKYKQDEYTVVYNCSAGPKRCAQTLLPLLHYYDCAMSLGYLKNRDEIS